VADALRGAIIKCYYLEVRKLKRRLTFKGVDTILNELEKQLYNNIFIPGNRTKLTKKEILDSLQKIRDILVYNHNGLFQYLVDNLINKVQVFGLHFAALDVRQESSVHNTVLEEIAQKTGVLPENYASLNEEEKIKILSSISTDIGVHNFEDG